MTALAVFSCSVQSQVVNKGDRLFGGSFMLTFFNSNGPVYNGTGNVGLLPSFGRAVRKNTVLGVKGNISYSRSKTENVTADESIATSFTVGPGIFLRKYRLLKNRFGVYLNHELNGYYTFQKQKGGLMSVPVTSKGWGGSYNFNPGVFYKFSERFLGEANIGGLSMSYSRSGPTDNFGIGATFLQYFNVGISYVIAKN